MVNGGKMLTMGEVEPLGLCITTQKLMDRRFRSSFGDNLILRDRDPDLEPKLLKIKREMNSGMNEKKYIDGHKMVIVNNIDKILGLVDRFTRVNLATVEKIIFDGKDLIKKVMKAENFDDIERLGPAFKSQITLPIYELFIKESKERFNQG